MSDLRDPEPDVREFEIESSGSTAYVFEIEAWPYSSLRNDKVISRRLVYRMKASEFRDVVRIAEAIRATVQAVHDVWMARIVRVGESRP